MITSIPYTFLLSFLTLYFLLIIQYQVGCTYIFISFLTVLYFRKLWFHIHAGYVHVQHYLILAGVSEHLQLLSSLVLL